MNEVALSRATLRDFQQSSSAEWLLTNGIGGFAASSVSGANTRRYHGLLTAAFEPPGGRTVLLSSLDEEVLLSGKQYQLSSNEFSDGTIHPNGYRLLESFTLDGLLPVWRFALGEALLEKRIWMPQGENSIYVKYTLLRSNDAVQLSLRPRCAYRDYHGHQRGEREFELLECRQGLSLRAIHSEKSFFIKTNSGALTLYPTWHWNFRHRMEEFRGLDSTEDLFVPGVFNTELRQGESCVLAASLDENAIEKSSESLSAEIERQKKVLAPLPEAAPWWIRQLTLAGSQFLVSRARPNSDSPGTSIIAGYPWFMDWTRDTMISLPGLCVSSGKTDLASATLETYADYLSEGMLPNRFLEDPSQMEFNSVDAALLFVAALQRCHASTKNFKLLERLYPTLLEIVRYYSEGTRHNIKEDPADGLIFAGTPGLQLTWMDAKVGNWVVTPRIGKTVEANALWYNALMFISETADMLDHVNDAKQLSDKATRTKIGFQSFWNSQLDCLYDVLETPSGTQDPSIRPNQLFAAALPFRALKRSQEKRIVDICASELLTPVGMRSLAASDQAYRPSYGGDQTERDGAYHQGTVWTWPLGYFIRAHYNVYQDRNAALSFLGGIEAHLFEGALGSVSEIFDAEAPHAPRGCFAQAWSVAEILDVWTELTSNRAG